MRSRAKLARVALLLVAGATHLAWLATLVTNLGAPELGRRDWSAFRAAGAAVLEGAPIYAPAPGGFPFLHPPAVAVLSAPVSGLSDLAFTGLMTAVSIAGWVGVAWSLRRLRGAGAGAGADPELVLLIGLASAPWLIALVLGQPSIVLVAAWLGGYVLLERRPLHAGLIWSLCALKPPFLVPLLVYAALRRSPLALTGLVAGALVLLVGLALPLGPEIHAEWIAAMIREQPGAALSWKQHTLFALLRALMPLGSAWLVWLGCAGALGVLVLRRLVAHAPSLRGFGLLALASVVLSPYAYFYDALVLLIPVAALVARPTRARALAALATGATQYLVFLVIQGGPALAAVPALAWLGLELSEPWDSRTRPEAAATSARARARGHRGSA